MKVSVIVPAFNAEATLEAAVNSLLATGYPDLEILVVDDGSSDATLPVAQQLVVLHPEVVRVCVHAGSGHCGVSASRNLGIRNSSGELIAFLDADDVVLPHRFQFSVPMLCERPDVDGVYELTRIVNCDSINRTREQWLDGEIFGLADALVGEDLLGKLMTGIPWGTCGFLCRRGLFERIGFFDESRTMAEDCHLWIRAAAAAKIVPADPLTVVSLYVRHGANSYQYSLERRLDLLDAMADAGLWIKRHASPMENLWRAGFMNYLVRGLVASRETRDFGLVVRQISLCLSHRFYGIAADRRVMRQLVGALRDWCWY